MCDVRKGTSTRKPRLNPDMVAQQQQAAAQALTPPPVASLAPPPPPTKSPAPSPAPSDASGQAGGGDEEETDLAALASLKANKRPAPSSSAGAKEPKAPKKPKEPRKTNSVTKARLKNVDRSSATYHSVTVNDFTVVITEFKPKAKKERKEKKSAADK